MALKRGKKLINSIATEYDGISFKSRLEVNCYKALKEADIKFKYEPTSYEVLGSFLFEHNSYERLANGKGDFINRGNKKVLGMKYTPDFVGDGFIIEVKGRPNERFPVVWKLFKKMIVTKGIDVDLYMPRNKKDCDDVVESIIKKRKL